jgi:hypothetical protein
MTWLLNELKSIPYIIGGIILLFIGMVISDAITGTIDRLWKKKNH